MAGLHTLFEGLIQCIVDPVIIIYMVFGTLGGMIFGAIPGLTAALGVSLMLPFTFYMTPVQGIATLIGIYVGGISGGLVAAILINIPGTAASLVTCFDGHPMAKQGRAIEALSYGVTSSLIGGLFSGVALVLLAPQLVKIALLFGPWEYFAMGIVGLSIVVALSSENMIKGLMGAVFGLLLAMAGCDTINSIPRFTFGYWQLNPGFDTLATIMGLFVIPEVLMQVRNLDKEIIKTQIDMDKSLFPKLSMFKGRYKALSISAVMGTIIGIMPGVGQSTASLLAYNQVRTMSKHPEEFGKGNLEGVIASETANNAVCGGALIPMLSLGIPGDLVTAILMGGLTIHNINPGPLLFRDNIGIVGNVFASYILSCLIMFVLFMFLMRFFVKVLDVPMQYLLPMILMMCVIGTMTVNNRIFDSWIFLIIGVIGYLITSVGINLPPIVLGYILGNIIEMNFRTALVSFSGDVTTVFKRPISCSLLILALFLIIYPLLKDMTRKKKQQQIAGR